MIAKVNRYSIAKLNGDCEMRTKETYGYVINEYETEEKPTGRQIVSCDLCDKDFAIVELNGFSNTPDGTLIMNDLPGLIDGVHICPDCRYEGAIQYLEQIGLLEAPEVEKRVFFHVPAGGTNNHIQAINGKDGIELRQFNVIEETLDFGKPDLVLTQEGAKERFLLHLSEEMRIQLGKGAPVYALYLMWSFE